MNKMEFKKVKLGTKVVENPLVMPPLVIWQSDESGLVKDNHRLHYSRCSGAGYTIVEATAVSPEGRLASTQLGIFNDNQTDGLADIARIIKSHGSLAGIQIHHAGGNTNRNKTWGATPLVPSLSAYPEGADYEELSKDQIKRIIGDFVLGAQRAVKAGFDVIELHGAHGYLIAQFLSPKKNRRTDEYGGSLENRQRFLVEVVTAVQKAIGDRALLSCRLGVADSPSPDGEPHLTIEEGIATAQLLESMGLPFLNISVANGVDPAMKPEGSPYSDIMHHAIAVKKALSIPVIGVGGVKLPEQADKLLQDNLVDMVAVGKGILSDPHWFKSALAGESVHPCYGCKPCLWFSKDKINSCPSWKKRGQIPFSV